MVEDAVLDEATVGAPACRRTKRYTSDCRARPFVRIDVVGEPAQKQPSWAECPSGLPAPNVPVSAAKLDHSRLAKPGRGSLFIRPAVSRVAPGRTV